MCSFHFIKYPLKKTVLLSIILALPKTLYPQTNISFELAWENIQTYYHKTLREEGVIGSSLYFIKNGKVLAKEFYGLADIDQKRSVDANTIFHWASITKTLTGIAIMQLRDRGLLSLDDHIINYIPEVKAVHNPFGDIKDITIRHVMSHSAGFRAPTWPWGGDESWHPHEPTSWQQLVAMFPYTKILFEPGSKYSYSNPAIIFLGRIIELLSGDDYEVYIDKNILKPLKMYTTYFDTTPYHLLKDRSNNYYVIDGEIHANGLDFDTGITVSNSGLNAPLPDMVKYLTFLCGDPDDAYQYDSILKRSSLEEMWQIEQEIEKNNYSTTSMGLIFFIINHKNRRFIGHTGSQKAFISFFYIDPKAKTGCIAAFNTVGRSTDGRSAKPATSTISNELRLALFENIFPLFY